MIKKHPRVMFFSFIFYFLFFIFNITPVLAQNIPANKKNASAPADAKSNLADVRIEASKTSAIRAKLQLFKNQIKASAAARINTNLNAVNQKQSSQMQKLLDKMSAIMDKLEARVNKGAPDIKDPSLAKAAIASARTAIASASAAVSAQAQKDYTIQVTSESRIKADAKLQRDKLHADLLALRKTVVEAKNTVANAIRVAKSGSLTAPASTGPAIKNKEGTSSGRR